VTGAAFRSRPLVWIGTMLVRPLHWGTGLVLLVAPHRVATHLFGDGDLDATRIAVRTVACATASYYAKKIELPIRRGKVLPRRDRKSRHDATAIAGEVSPPPS
jgi:hypothetical protein